MGHAVSNPFQATGFTQFLVSQSRQPDHVWHGQRRQDVHEHQRAEAFEARAFHCEEESLLSH